MFESLAIQYYHAEDETLKEIIKKTGEYERGAMSSLGKSFAELLREKHHFHDWFLSQMNVFCQSGRVVCQIVIKNENPNPEEECVLQFCGVKLLKVHNDLVSQIASCYPSPLLGSSFAWIQDFWIAHQERLRSLHPVGGRKFYSAEIRIHIRR